MFCGVDTCVRGRGGGDSLNDYVNVSRILRRRFFAFLLANDCRMDVSLTLLAFSRQAMLSCRPCRHGGIYTPRPPAYHCHTTLFIFLLCCLLLAPPKMLVFPSSGEHIVPSKQCYEMLAFICFLCCCNVCVRVRCQRKRSRSKQTPSCARYLAFPIRVL